MNSADAITELRSLLDSRPRASAAIDSSGARRTGRRLSRTVAFLRAINVGGRVVKMDRLRVLFEAAGLKNVETFIASGNVIFDSTRASTARLEATIEKQLNDGLGYEVATFLRSEAEVVGAAEHAAFPDEDMTGSVLYVLFLKSSPSDAAVKKLLSLRTAVDDFHINGRDVYWLQRRAVGESKVAAGTLERALQMSGTARNITTVRRIAAKS